MSDTGSENAQDTTGQGEASDDTREGTSDAQGASQDQQGSKENEGTGDTVTREEFEQIKRRMQAADKRASDAEKELNERKRAEQTELENAQQDLKVATDRIAELEKLINSTALETEFIKYGKHEWVDVNDALRLLDREGVEVKDGKVTGLGPAIEKLAKSKPYLVKSKSGDQNDSSGASGSASNGRRKGDSTGKKPDFSSRFPALRK